MRDKETLITAFYSLDYNDIYVLNTLADNVTAYLAAYGPDTGLELILHAINATKKDYLNIDFIEICNTAKPAVDILQTIDWGLFEIDILVSVIGFIESFDLTTVMMEKALHVLDNNFADTEHHDYIKLRMFFQMTLRFLHAKFYDDADPQEIKKKFDMCFDSAILLSEQLNLPTYRTVLLVRHALFNEDSVKVLEYVEALEATEEMYFITSTKDEVVKYVKHLSENVTTELRNFMIGRQIKKLREELGIKTIEFADMIGSTQTVVNQIERGATGVSATRLYVIAKALNVTDLSYFYGGAINKPANTITDITTHQIAQIVSKMPDEDKTYILNFIKGFSKHIKKKT